MSCSFLHSKYLNVRPWTSVSNQEGYLWPYWSRASRALYTPGTARRCRTRSEHNSPSMAILVSCIVPSLRSVCYKYTTTGNLWTGAEHTESHSCSMLQIDGVSQGYWWFVWMHRETRMGRSVEHLHVEPLSTTSATRPNVTQGHQQVKQPATSGKKWNMDHSELHARELWEEPRRWTAYRCRHLRSSRRSQQTIPLTCCW